MSWLASHGEGLRLWRGCQYIAWHDGRVSSPSMRQTYNKLSIRGADIARNRRQQVPLVNNAMWCHGVHFSEAPKEEPFAGSH